MSIKPAPKSASAKIEPLRPFSIPSKRNQTKPISSFLTKTSRSSNSKPKCQTRKSSINSNQTSKIQKNVKPIAIISLKELSTYSPNGKNAVSPIGKKPFSPYESNKNTPKMSLNPCIQRKSNLQEFKKKSHLIIHFDAEIDLVKEIINEPSINQINEVFFIFEACQRRCNFLR